MLFIQGYFYQAQSGYLMDVAEVKIEMVPTAVVFGGTIAQQEHNECLPLSGEMRDTFGSAVLSNVVITEAEISFVKRYYEDGKSWPEKGIQWVLHKSSDGTWTGEYVTRSRFNANSEPVVGPIRCTVVEAKDALFQKDLEDFSLSKNYFKAVRTAKLVSAVVDKYAERGDDEIPF